MIDDPIRLQVSRPESLPGGGLRGEVIEIDTFGNLATNLDETHLQSMGEVRVVVGDSHIDGLVKTFGDRPPGTQIALYGTSHDLIISIVNGDAAHTLNLKLGDKVDVHPLRKDK